MEVDSDSDMYYAVDKKTGLTVQTKEAKEMKKHWQRGLLLGVSLTLLLAGGVALSACGGSGPSVEVVTSAVDIVGVWRRTQPWAGAYETGIAVRQWFLKVEADGTMAFGESPDQWDYEACSEEFAFEGTQFSVTETACNRFQGEIGEDKRFDYSCVGLEAPSGVYEVQLLANGNLKFIDAGDNCQYRRDILTLSDWELVS